MDSISKIVEDTLTEADGKSVEQITDVLNKRIAEAGIDAPLKVVATGNVDKRTNNDCPSTVEACKEYKVDHGDGTFSPPWWGPWECY